MPIPTLSVAPGAIRTLPEPNSTTSLSVWTVNPPAKVEVAVVEVAVKWVAVEVP